MDNKLCIGLFVLVIVIIIVGLLYKYSNKLEHFYSQADGIPSTVISTGDIQLDDISASIDKYNSVHIWGTFNGKLYKLKAGRFTEDTSYGTTGDTRINEISTFISKDDRVSIFAIKNDINTNIWFKKLHDDSFYKNNNGSLRTIDLAVSPNGEHSMYIGIGTDGIPYQQKQEEKKERLGWYDMGGSKVRLLYNAINDEGKIFSLCKNYSGRFYYYNGNLQKVQDRGFGWEDLNVINKNIFDFKLKFKKDGDGNKLCVMVLVYNNPTYNLCYKIFDVSDSLGNLKNNIKSFLENPINQSIDQSTDQNISDISKSDVTLNDTGINHKRDGTWSMRTLRSLFDFEFDYDGNIHIWMLKQDKLSITYYTNSPGYTLPDDINNTDKYRKAINLQNIRGSYITNKNEPSDNISDNTNTNTKLTIIINDDTTISFFSSDTSEDTTPIIGTLLSARKDGSIVTFIKKNEITDEEKFNITDNGNGTVSLRNLASSLYLSINTNGNIVQNRSTSNKENFKLIDSDNNNVGSEITELIFTSKYKEVGWNNNDKMDRLDNVSVNVDSLGNQYLWGTLKNNTYNRKLGTKIIEDSKNYNWKQTPGFASQISVSTDSYKKQYLWCVRPDNTIWYAMVAPNTTNLSTTLGWTQIEGSIKKVVSNVTCDGIQLIWGIGVDDKVKHIKYNRIFNKLSEWTDIKDKNDNDILAKDITVYLDNNGIQNLLLVNQDKIMELEFDTNFNKIKETTKDNILNLVKISSAVNEGGTSKIYAIDNENKVYLINSLDEIGALKHIRFKEISNGLDASGSEYIWAITPGNLVFYKTTFTLKQTTDYDTLLTPDVKNYINNQLNKYSDGQSLPTLTELKALEKLKDNNTAEQIAEIPNLLKDFKNQTQNYVEFHNDYDSHLEKLLNEYLDVKKGIDSVESKKNEQRLLNIKNKLKLNGYNNPIQTNTPDTEKNGSLRNLSNGKMINFEKKDTDTLLLRVKGKMVDKETTSSDTSGCLSYDIDKDAISINSECNNNDTNNLSFKVSEIKNTEEYNDLMNKMPRDWKTNVSDYDNVNYPFKVVQPINNNGFCLDYDENELRILPCYNSQTQRFRKHKYQIKNEKCQ